MCQTMLVLYFRHYLFCIHVVILTLTRNELDLAIRGGFYAYGKQANFDDDNIILGNPDDYYEVDSDDQA